MRCEAPNLTVPPPEPCHRLGWGQHRSTSRTHVGIVCPAAQRQLEIRRKAGTVGTQPFLVIPEHGGGGVVLDTPPHTRRLSGRQATSHVVICKSRIATAQRIAEARGCEVGYALVPIVRGDALGTRLLTSQRDCRAACDRLRRP